MTEEMLKQHFLFFYLNRYGAIKLTAAPNLCCVALRPQIKAIF